MMINDYHLSDSVHHGFYDEKLMHVMMRLYVVCVMFNVLLIVSVVNMIFVQIVEMYDV